MLTKLITFAIIAFGAFAAFRRFGNAVSQRSGHRDKSERKAAQRRMQSEELIRCDACEAWVHPSDTCSCKTKST